MLARSPIAALCQATAGIAKAHIRQRRALGCDLPAIPGERIIGALSLGRL